MVVSILLVLLVAVVGAYIINTMLPVPYRTVTLAIFAILLLLWLATIVGVVDSRVLYR